MTITPLEITTGTSIGATTVAGIIATTYTSSEVVTIIVALGGLATIVGGVIVSIITARINASAKATSDKLAAVELAAESIKTSVDGQSHAASARSDMDQREKALLRETIAKLEDTARTLAASTAAANVAGVAAAHPSMAAPASLQNIDTNTKAIEKNTARTQATVQDLKDQQ